MNGLYTYHVLRIPHIVHYPFNAGFFTIFLRVLMMMLVVVQLLRNEDDYFAIYMQCMAIYCNPSMMYNSGISNDKIHPYHSTCG